MSENAVAMLNRIQREIHDTRVAKIVLEVSVAIEKSMDDNCVIVAEYKGFVVLEVFEKLIENYRIKEFAAKWGKTMILAIILILPSLGASRKGVFVPEKTVKPLILIVPAVPHSRAGHRGTIKTDAPIDHPVWYNQLMTKYLSDTYGISPNGYSYSPNSPGSSVIINPYVLQPLSGKQQIKQNQRLYQSKGK